MSEWSDTKKRFEELKKSDKPPEKQEKPTGSSGGNQSAELNLLNVSGTNQQAKASSPDATPKKDARPEPEKKKEESSSLISSTGSFLWGTLKGGVKTIVSMPADIYHAAVNPDTSKLYSQIARGQTPRSADAFGMQASLLKTGGDALTGIGYLTTHRSEVFNQAVTRWNNASAEQRGNMFGSTITVGGTLFLGTGLGGKVFRFGRTAEEGSALGNLGKVGKAAELGRGAAIVEDLGRGSRIARLTEEVEAASQVLPRARTAGKIEEAVKSTQFLRNGRNAELINGGRITEALGGERTLANAGSASEKLAAELKSVRSIVARGSGSTAEIGAETRALTVIEKEEQAIAKAARALEKGPGGAADTVARRELSEAVTRYRQAVGNDAHAIRDMDRALAEFDSALTSGRGTKLASAGGETRIAARGSEVVTPERLAAELNSRQELFGKHIQQFNKELSATGKAEDALAIQRSRELEDSMRTVSRTTDAAAREKAVTDFEVKFRAYTDAMKESSVGKSGKFDFAVSDRTAAEFRNVARGVMDFSPAAEAAASPYAKLLKVESAAVREEQVTEQLTRARELTAGSNTAEAQAIRREAQAVEDSMRTLRNAERTASEFVSRDKATSEAALVAREKAAAEFETRLVSYDKLIKESKLAETSGVELRIADQAAIDARNVARVAREISPVVTDANAAARVETAASATRSAAVADVNTAAKAEEVVAGSKGAAVADVRTAAKVDEAVAAGKGSVVSDTSAAGRGTLAADASVAGRGTAASDLAAGAAQREVALSATKGQLSEAISLGDAALRERALGVQQNLGRFEAVMANRVAETREIEAASTSFRDAIRSYNEAVRTSGAARDVVGRLILDQSLANPTRMVVNDRLLDLTPSLLGPGGSRAYLERNIADKAFGAWSEQGPLSTRVDFNKLAQASGDGWWSASKAKLDEAVSRAVDSVFWRSSIVQGITQDGFMSYLRSSIPRTGADWIALGKGYTILNNTYIIGKDLIQTGREYNAQVAAAQTGQVQDNRVTATGQGQAGTAATAGRATAGGAAERTATGPDSAPAQRTASTGQSSGADPGSRRDAAAALGSVQRDVQSAPQTSHDKASSNQVVASPQGPALSPVVQALAVPRPDAQVMPRGGVAAEELKKKPSWWSTVYGDNSGHRPLLKADDSKPADEARVAPILPPPRRIGGSEGNSQRVITPTFNPSFIRMQSELLGTAGNRAMDSRLAMAGGGDRKGRVRGVSLQDEDKLVKQFPFLVSGSSANESGMRRTGSNFSAKAEDQEHKSMGKITGGAGAATASGLPGGQDEDGAPVLVAQGGPQQQPNAGTTQDEENGPQ